jgi:hypothetical protein
LLDCSKLNLLCSKFVLKHSSQYTAFFHNLLYTYSIICLLLHTLPNVTHYNCYSHFRSLETCPSRSCLEQLTTYIFILLSVKLAHLSPILSPLFIVLVSFWTFEKYCSLFLQAWNRSKTSWQYMFIFYKEAIQKNTELITNLLNVSFYTYYKSVHIQFRKTLPVFFTSMLWNMSLDFALQNSILYEF